MSAGNVDVSISGETIAKFKDEFGKFAADKKRAEAARVGSKRKPTASCKGNQGILEKLRSNERGVDQKLYRSGNAQAQQLESKFELHRPTSNIDSQLVVSPRNAEHLANQAKATQRGHKHKPGCPRSRGSEGSSFFKNSCRLEEYNVHLEGELSALQQRFALAKISNERLEQKLDALALQMTRDQSVIADLDRNRTQLVEERNTLAEKCETFEAQIRSLQRNIDLQSRLQSSALGGDDRSMGQESYVVEDHNRIMQDLRTFYDNILMKTKEMFDERLTNLDEKLSRCEDEKTELRGGRTGIREQKEALAELRRQIENLMDNAKLFSKDSKPEAGGQNSEHLARLQNELKQREEQLVAQERLREHLEGALRENEKLKLGEAEHLSKIKSAEARVADLENELRSASRRLRENGRLE